MGKIAMKWLNLLGFLCVVYVCTVSLFQWYATLNGARIFSVEVPILGTSWLPAPLWFCAVVSLVTAVLAFVSVCIRCRIGSLPISEKKHANIKLPNLKISVDLMDKNRHRRTVQILSPTLFLISVLLIAVPALMGLLVERTPFLGELFGFTESLVRNAFFSAGYELLPSMEIALRITQASIHQCFIFLFAYWFFHNLKRGQSIPAAMEKR